MAQTSAITARREFKKRLMLGLDLKPLHVACHHCEETILSDMLWRCSYCDAVNRRTKVYSFLNKCQKCEREPKSFDCPECEWVTFLDADKNLDNPALLFVEVKRTMPKPPPPKEDPRLKKRREHGERKEDLEQKIEIARLDVELQGIKSANGEMTPQEKIKREIEGYLAKVMGHHMAVTEYRAVIANRYKDDANSLEMANAALTHFLEDRI